MSRYRAALLAAQVLLALPGPAAHALDDDPDYQILTLRLAISATDALQLLAAQGITGTAIQLGPAGCTLVQAEFCARSIRARTRDGELMIQLTRALSGPERQVVYRIAYTITGRGPADAETLRADAIDRYGRPTSVATTTWCPRLDITTGLCPPGQPRLHIEPAPKAAALVTLSDETMLNRTGLPVGQ